MVTLRSVAHLVSRVVAGDGAESRGGPGAISDRGMPRIAGDPAARRPDGDVPGALMRVRDRASAGSGSEGAARGRPLISAEVPERAREDDGVVAVARGVVQSDLDLIAGALRQPHRLCPARAIPDGRRS